MGLKPKGLRGESEYVIPVKEMQVGQVGRVVHWSTGTNSYHGLLVKRFTNTLVSLTSDDDWSLLPGSSECLVEILPNGYLLEVYNNGREP
jgi:hypothetical protein